MIKPQTQGRYLLELRTGLLAAGCLLVAFPAWFQPLLDRIWTTLQASTIYNLSTWETFLTITSYILIEAAYTSLSIDPNTPYSRHDLRPGHAHLYRNGTPLIRPYARRTFELVEYVGPLLLLDFIMVKKFVGVPKEDIIASGGYSLETIAGAARDSVTGVGIRADWKVPTLHHFTWSNPLQVWRALPRAAPSSREVVVTVIGALIIYDALFFVPHVLMHRINWLWKLHVPHHHHAEIHPQVTNQLTVTERLTLLLSANLALHLVQAHPFSRTIFVPIFLYLLIENHSGLDLPYAYCKVLPKGWAQGNEEHAEHHRRGGVNFEPYFTWIDRLCGTYSNGKRTRTELVEE